MQPGPEINVWASALQRKRLVSLEAKESINTEKILSVLPQQLPS